MKINTQSLFAVVGAGIWGNAFAKSLRMAGQEVIIWDRRQDSSKTIISLKQCNEADFIVLALPIQVIRGFLNENSDFLRPGQKCLILSKGIEKNTLALPHEVVMECRANVRVGLVSGPNFADEVARGLPAVSTLATQDIKIATVMDALHCNIRFELCQDLTGVALCGAIKNVIAIGCGIISGIFGSQNMQVAFIMRTIEELKQLVEHLGGSNDTVYTPAGIGDIILTATSMQSRNYSFGYHMAMNKHETTGGKTIEGVETATALHQMIKRHKLKLDALSYISQVIQDGDINKDMILEMCRT
jgi:glycerol-3-phosphate dehydrogenase (NAD(P)+)